MRVPILRICEDTQKLALTIVQAGCDGGQLLSLVKLRIAPAGCITSRKLVGKWENCVYTETEDTELPAGTIEYPAFEVDEDGKIVFYFDKLLWQQPPGRYNAYVMIDGVCTTQMFKFDLCKTPLYIESIDAVKARGELC